MTPTLWIGVTLIFCIFAVWVIVQWKEKQRKNTFWILIGMAEKYLQNSDLVISSFEVIEDHYRELRNLHQSASALVRNEKEQQVVNKLDRESKEWRLQAVRRIYRSRLQELWQRFQSVKESSKQRVILLQIRDLLRDGVLADAEKVLHKVNTLLIGNVLKKYREECKNQPSLFKIPIYEKALREIFDLGLEDHELADLEIFQKFTHEFKALKSHRNKKEKRKSGKND